MNTTTVSSMPVSAKKTSTGVWGLPFWYAGAFNALVIATFALIALGGSVRIMNAGLACPDWPLCFGDVIPDYHPQVYFEFIHRVVAGLVSIMTVALVFLLVFRSTAPRALKMTAAGAVGLLVTQVVFGGLTVLLQLHSKVVAAHLGMGTGFFALLLWIYLSLKNEKPVVPFMPWAKRLTLFMLVVVYAQILLGGLVASHFASLVCSDFPTCHGEWFPTFRGIIGLHIIHRLGGYVVFASSLASLLILTRAFNREAAAEASVQAEGMQKLKRLSVYMFLFVCVQVCIGIANVLLHTPPLIAVAHLATGTAVLSIAVRQLHLAFARQ
jgi:heme a synthase